eukprot:TRINITY_DN53090_c0_g1_i1.p2 TRINITY_DN53090_c0_g1~~TRINITY_DN53090_c0_g1_i1.p2  ORF type:complete len:308 (+),score=148.91 TRINITY_DN53090_c0_g1_i1:132-1055(+)
MNTVSTSSRRRSHGAQSNRKNVSSLDSKIPPKPKKRRGKKVPQLARRDSGNILQFNETAPTDSYKPIRKQIGKSQSSTSVLPNGSGPSGAALAQQQAEQEQRRNGRQNRRGSRSNSGRRQSQDRSNGSGQGNGQGAASSPSTAAGVRAGANPLQRRDSFSRRARKPAGPVRSPSSGALGFLDQHQDKKRGIKVFESKRKSASGIINPQEAPKPQKPVNAKPVVFPPGQAPDKNVHKPKYGKRVSMSRSQSGTAPFGTENNKINPPPPPPKPAHDVPVQHAAKTIPVSHNAHVPAHMRKNFSATSRYY